MQGSLYSIYALFCFRIRILTRSLRSPVRPLMSQQLVSKVLVFLAGKFGSSFVSKPVKLTSDLNNEHKEREKEATDMSTQ